MKRFLLLVALVSAPTFAQPPATGDFLLRMEPVRSGFTLQNATKEEWPLLMQHGAYLKGLLDEGKVTFAGQVFDPKGFWGIVVVHAPDLDAATAILNSDPGVKAKVFRGEVIPFRTVFFRAPSVAAK